MSRTRRSFTAEFKVEAARRVIDGGRPVAEVGRELNLMRTSCGNGSLQNASGTGLPPAHA